MMMEVGAEGVCQEGEGGATNHGAQMASRRRKWQGKDLSPSLRKDQL